MHSNAKSQHDLFRSIHELVEVHGPQDAIKIAQSHSLEKDSEASALTDPILEVVAGRSGRKIVDAAASSLVREIEGGSSIG